MTQIINDDVFVLLVSDDAGGNMQVDDRFVIRGISRFLSFKLKDGFLKKK